MAFSFDPAIIATSSLDLGGDRSPMNGSSAGSIDHHWQRYRRALLEEARLGALKSFRDHLLCDQQFAAAFADDPASVLTATDSRLRPADLIPFISPLQRQQLGCHDQPSDLALLLKQALGLDQALRQQFMQAAPLHRGWRTWRALQMQRYRREDSSPRASQITHIPFAIELTVGCSGGCAFCGLSAPPLQGSEPEIAGSEAVFRELLRSLASVCGDFGQGGVLYWATDPLDDPAYEHHAALFAEQFGCWPHTTTALAETQLLRFQRLLHSPATDRPWGIRCSMRSPAAFRKLQRGLSDQERALVQLLPQYPQAATQRAIAGRAFDPAALARQEEVGGTIACMSGLLISLPRRQIQLITPCRAEPCHPNGYRVIASLTVETTAELSAAVDQLINLLPLPPIGLEQRLRVAIDSSQFSLYRSPSFPDLLAGLQANPRSLAQLSRELRSERHRIDLLSHCLSLVQAGVIQVDALPEQDLQATA